MRMKFAHNLLPYRPPLLLVAAFKFPAENLSRSFTRPNTAIQACMSQHSEKMSTLSDFSNGEGVHYSSIV